MQEVQPTPKAPAVTGVYPQIRRPRPAEQVPESDGDLFIALLSGFTSALSTARPHHACAPHREKVMSEVQPTPVHPTPKIPMLVSVHVLLIPAHPPRGKPARLPRRPAGRPTAMACAPPASGQPAAGGPRRSGGRQCGYVPIP